MSKKKHNNEFTNPTNDVSVEDYAAAMQELNELKRQNGTLNESKISRFISSLFERRDARERVSVNKKKLLWIALLTGWCGGHRFYTKRYILAAFYLVFFWSGVPAAMTIIDLMEIIPIAADENGNILI